MNKWSAGIGTQKDDPTQRLYIAVLETENPKKIIALTGYAGANDEQESIDNAKLIAAIPDMTAIIRRVFDLAQHKGDWTFDIVDACLEQLEAQIFELFIEHKIAHIITPFATTAGTIQEVNE